MKQPRGSIVELDQSITMRVRSHWKQFARWVAESSLALGVTWASLASGETLAQQPALNPYGYPVASPPAYQMAPQASVAALPAAYPAPGMMYPGALPAANQMPLVASLPALPAVAGYPSATTAGGPMIGYGQPAAPMAMPMPMAAPMAMPYGYVPYGAAYPGQMASYGGPPEVQAMPMEYGSAAAGFEGCANCGGYGCEACGGGAGLFGGALSRIGPYGEGGCCAPRWYDITLDAMFLKREDAARRVNFSSDGIAGPIILSTDDLDFHTQAGMKLTGAIQFFAGSNLELTYFGLFNWASSAAAPASTFPDDIFSVVSSFGLAPFNGFDETDRARGHSISYSSTVDNFELNVRKRFTAPNCRIQYSWLAGVRYLYLMEDFNYLTVGGDADGDPLNGFQSRGSMDYNVRTKNSLTGFQLGGDVWTCVIPGIFAGGDVRAGVFGNYGDQGTNITATTTLPANTTVFSEKAGANDIALVADANLQAIYRVNPNWTAKVGYSFLYVDGVLLAPENFNTTPPNFLNPAGVFAFPQRTAAKNDNGSVFLHGFTAGFEWMW